MDYAETRNSSHSGPALNAPEVSTSILSCRSTGGDAPHWGIAGCRIRRASASSLCVPNHATASSVVIDAEHKPTTGWAQPPDSSPLIVSRYGRVQHRLMDTIGKRVRHLRKEREWTQTELAKRVGVTQSAVAQIEGGVTETLRGEVLAGLCREFGTLPEYLLWGQGRVADHETAMLMAELARLAQTMTARALGVLLQRAREYAAIGEPAGELTVRPIAEADHEPSKRRATRPPTIVTTRVGRRAREASGPADRGSKKAKRGA